MVCVISTVLFCLWMTIILVSWSEVIRAVLFKSFGVSRDQAPVDRATNINRWMWGTDTYGPLSFSGEFATGNSNYYFLMWHSCNGFHQMIPPGIRTMSIDQLEDLRFVYLENETAPSNS